MTVNLFLPVLLQTPENEVKRLQMRIAKAVQPPGFSNIKPRRGLSRVLGNSLARFLGGSGAEAPCSTRSAQKLQRARYVPKSL